MMTNHQLRRWLMREVHGVEIPRKPAQKSFSALGKPPARNWKYKAWVRSLPCAVCGVQPAGEAAHTGSDGGMSQKASDYSCVPLCCDCHTQGEESYHRIGRERFEAAHGLDIADLVKRLNHAWFKGLKEPA